MTMRAKKRYKRDWPVCLLSLSMAFEYDQYPRIFAWQNTQILEIAALLTMNRDIWARLLVRLYREKIFNFCADLDLEDMGIGWWC